MLLNCVQDGSPKERKKNFEKIFKHYDQVKASICLPSTKCTLCNLWHVDKLPYSEHNVCNEFRDFFIKARRSYI